MEELDLFPVMILRLNQLLTRKEIEMLSTLYKIPPAPKERIKNTIDLIDYIKKTCQICENNISSLFTNLCEIQNMRAV